MTYDVIIIGSGAGGLSSAIYAGRYLMKVLVIGGEFGGETSRAGTIWNYPGARNVDGFDLMMTMKDQANDVGTEFVDGKVSSLKKDGGCFEAVVNGVSYRARTVILTMGAERKRLGLPNESELTGKGVHYCVTCDGPVYRGKTVAMVGGGDSSVKGVNLLAQFVDKVIFILREKEPVAEPINLEDMKKLGDRVEILPETEVTALHGTDRLEKISLSNGKDLMVDGLFVEIGAVPNTELPKDLGVELDAKGYILVDPLMNTNVSGVYSAGDATNIFGRFKQSITAAATGAVAATSAYEYIKKNPDLCPNI